MIHIMRPDRSYANGAIDSKRMDPSFDPMIQLKTLLGDKPNHPWGALIPQVLLWCFRRFCIQKLTETSEELLAEQLWDDHFDLIHQHAPKGLESVSSTWFTPENIEHVHSSLEEFNRFFMEVLVLIDHAVRESDEECESSVAEFLDVQIREAITEWLGEEFAPFLIFPTDDAMEDEFTDDQFNTLLDALMAFMAAHPSPPEPVPEAAPEAPPEAVPEPPPRDPTIRESYPPPDYPHLTPPPPYLFAQYGAPFKEPNKTRHKRIQRAFCGKTRRIH